MEIINYVGSDKKEQKGQHANIALKPLSARATHSATRYTPSSSARLSTPQRYTSTLTSNKSTHTLIHPSPLSSASSKDGLQNLLSQRLVTTLGQTKSAQFSSKSKNALHPYTHSTSSGPAFNSNTTFHQSQITSVKPHTPSLSEKTLNAKTTAGVRMQDITMKENKTPPFIASGKTASAIRNELRETPPKTIRSSIASVRSDMIQNGTVSGINTLSGINTVSGINRTAARSAGRSPLAYIGMFASTVHSVINNVLPGAIAFMSAVSIGGILMLGTDWYASHTGPLALQDGSTAELDALSSIMMPSSIAPYTSGIHTADGCGEAEGEVDEIGALAAAAGSVIKSTVTWKTYTVQKGDTITGISRRFGLDNLSTIIAVNGVDNARAIQAGKDIRIPSMDGIVHTVVKGNTLAAVSAKYSVSIEDILDVNDLSTKELTVGQELFIPGATMDSSALREAMGDLFKCPIRVPYRLSSHFGWRADPFTGVRSYHSGVDMACPQGTPIYAAMGGKVITAGWSNVFGNYVIIDHHNGYQSLYGHMSKRIARKGQIVNQGDRLGLVGSTGYSTGPHLHFTVYKKGRLTDPLVLLRR